MANWNWTKNEGKNQSRNMPAQTGNASGMMPASMPYLMPLSQFYDTMDRMMDTTLRSLGNMGLPMTGMQGMFMPKVDISSTDKEYTIDVEVPGMREEDLRLDVTRDGELCICGEKRLENDNQEKDFHRVERSYGSFSRTLMLPEDADADNIEARFNNGVLTITAPRTQAAESHGRRIEINNADNARQQKQGRQDNQRQESANAATGPKRAA